MNELKPQDRPDYAYWNASRDERSKMDIEAIKAKLEVYSLARFGLGWRFRLRKDYLGIPKGICCTIIEQWPNTRIRWDKWAKTGRGSERKERCMSHELDLELEAE